MTPIHALLARIRWDPDFGHGRWEIAYLDRHAAHLVRVPLEDVHTQAHIGFVFDVIDAEGRVRSIPYHRVRQAWRDGKLIWTRLAPRLPARQQKPRPVRRRQLVQPRMRR